MMKIPGWVWFIAAAPALAGAVAWVRDGVRNALPPAAAAEAPQAIAPPAVEVAKVAPPAPKRAPAIVTAPKPKSITAPGTDVPVVAEPEADGPTYEEMAGKWATERTDTWWTRSLESSLRSVLDGARTSTDALQAIDCRQTLCRLVVDGGVGGAIALQQELVGSGRHLQYERQRVGSDVYYVALVDRIASD